MKGINPSSKSDGELIAEAINNLAKSVDNLASHFTYDEYEINITTMLRNAFVSHGFHGGLGDYFKDITRNGLTVRVED